MDEPLTSAQQQKHDAIRAVKDRNADALLSVPGVTGVGVGFSKDETGADTDELCLRVYTQTGKADAVRSQIGERVDGVRVAFIEFEYKKGAHTQRARYLEEGLTETEKAPVGDDAIGVDTGKYNPLVGGVSIGPSRSINGHYIAGTLGLMVRDRATGQPLMLSNHHVMCGDDGGSAPGDVICQPSRVDNFFGYCSNCAELLRSHVGNVGDGRQYGVDAAVAKLTYRGANIGEIAEVGERVTGMIAGHLNMPVFKRGRTTLETTGLIKDMSFDGAENFGPPYGRVVMRNQILVEPSVGRVFIQGGDSGSVLVNTKTMAAVGLCWASDNRNWGVASPIGVALDAVQADLY